MKRYVVTIIVDALSGGKIESTSRHMACGPFIDKDMAESYAIAAADGIHELHNENEKYWVENLPYIIE